VHPRRTADTVAHFVGARHGVLLTDNSQMSRRNTPTRRTAWIASVTVVLTTLILIAVLLTWSYGHRCNAWETKVKEQTDDMFYPAFVEVYTSEEIESMARRALDHERPKGC
jgi:thiaminase